jgi:hypothetical protein
VGGDSIDFGVGCGGDSIEFPLPQPTLSTFAWSDCGSRDCKITLDFDDSTSHEETWVIEIVATASEETLVREFAPLAGEGPASLSFRVTYGEWSARNRQCATIKSVGPRVITNSAPSNQICGQVDAGGRWRVE